jgi:hypothetical protein
MEGKAEESGIVTAVILQKPAQADAEAGFGVDGGLHHHVRRLAMTTITSYSWTTMTAL